MPFTREKAQLMSASEIDRTLVRLAHEILEKTNDLDKLAFVGIRRRGVPLALRLAAKIEELEKRKVPVGILDINLYRDDLSTVSEKPVHNSTDIQFPITGKDVVLMDDVLYTGRTIRAALDALFDQGRPARVLQCVELPGFSCVVFRFTSRIFAGVGVGVLTGRGAPLSSAAKPPSRKRTR